MKTAAFVCAVLLLASAPEAQAQETSIDVDVGSSRIGGPGLTRRERRAVAAMDAPDEWITEETLKPKGHRKRLPGLHVLAKRYHDGKMWKEACEKYDIIQEEYPEDGLKVGKDGGKDVRRMAARSYLSCAKAKFASSDFDKAERLLKKSERFGVSDHRHEGLRRKMMREEYRKKLKNGDIGGAIALFEKYNSKHKDEDERIWLGEQLATKAWAAYKSKDEITLKERMSQLERIAPMNTEYRKLKEKIEAESGIVTQVLGLGLAALLGVVLLNAFAKWRGRAKLGNMGPKNPFLDDDL